MAVTEKAIGLPEDYPQFLDHLKDRVRRDRVRASRVVNTELLLLYWDLGDAIAQQQQTRGWGAKVIDRLADDLRRAFPTMRGLSRTNLKYMRGWPRSGPALQSVNKLLANCRGGHLTVLLDKLDNRELRDWYAARAAEHGWSRHV